MTKEEAIRFVSEHYPYDPESDYCALLRIRHKAVSLPKYGVNGVIRDVAEWAYIDAAGKIDTGMYGDVYYFNEKEW